MTDKDKAMTKLNNTLKKNKLAPQISFDEFLEVTIEKPELVFRNIFQLFHDMIEYYVTIKKNEAQKNSSEKFIKYDCSKLFEEGVDTPFFADVLFSNKLVNLVKGFKKSAQNNTMYLFEGPPGCGKSIFLGNLIHKFEEFMRTPESTIYETVWKLDPKKIGKSGRIGFVKEEKENLEEKILNKDFIIPCPSHDHPILLIPKPNRKEFLDNLIKDQEFKKKLFNEKEYEWVFKKNSCAICTSIYQKLVEKLDDPSEVLKMVFPRKYNFNRRLGQGISIFGPKDIVDAKKNTDPDIQKLLNEFFNENNAVKYLYSEFAKTNNGIVGIMDLKGENNKRLIDLHGIMGDGVHKVQDIEEHIDSLFIGLANPEDSKIYKKIPSLKDRIKTEKIPYVLDSPTEVKIYKEKFSKNIESLFLPRVLENFAKIIIASRMNPESEALDEWIEDPSQYELWMDEDQLLLKMEIYAGKLPHWLSEENRKGFDKEVRKNLLLEREEEGFTGITGRESINILKELISKYSGSDKLITMDMASVFFKEEKGSLSEEIPEEFLNSLRKSYDFEVLQEMKESIYDYNEDRISKDIQNYLFCLGKKFGGIENCKYTGERIILTEEYLEGIETNLIGKQKDKKKYEDFRREVIDEYVSGTLDEMDGGRKLTETGQYKTLFERCIHNVKENILGPLVENENFRRAIQDYGKPEFKRYDKNLRHGVPLLIENLQKKFKYTSEGAKQICFYALDNYLSERFG